MKEGFEATCQVASRIAQRLDMPQAVQDALMHVFEQWDGHGMPYGIERDYPCHLSDRARDELPGGVPQSGRS